jgi:hypothetical protein
VRADFGSKVKSKLDWDSFTETAGLKDELQQNSKNGYCMHKVGPPIHSNLCLLGFWKRPTFCGALTSACTNASFKLGKTKSCV